jgi:plasmid maintenance system antidote protein VapI
VTGPVTTVFLSGEDIALLTEHLGSVWVARFTDTDDEFHADAVGELCEAVDELARGRHHNRADGQGCTCGWNGRDLLRHVVEDYREQSDAPGFPLAIDKFDWSRPPGRLIKTWGDAGGLADEDIATVCDLPLDVYRGIVAGSEHITTDIAHKLEAGTQTFPANVWLMLDRHYRAALVERARQLHH